MRTLPAVYAFLLPVIAFAQAVAPAPQDPTAQQLLDLIRFAGGAFKAGMWFSGVVACIIALVFVLRIYGKKLHEAIPDDSIADKPLWFLFDTKPGGVVLNGLTASGLVMTPVLLGGVNFTPALAGATLLAGIGASQAWGWIKDLYEWWQSRKPDPAAAKAAGVAASKDPGPTLNG
jgi:hypothetical protein